MKFLIFGIYNSQLNHNPHKKHTINYMIFNQNCNNLNIIYYHDLIKIDIEILKYIEIKH